MYWMEGEVFRGEKGIFVGVKGYFEVEYIKNEYDCDCFVV